MLQMTKTPEQTRAAKEPAVSEPIQIHNGNPNQNPKGLTVIRTIWDTPLLFGYLYFEVSYYLNY